MVNQAFKQTERHSLSPCFQRCGILMRCSLVQPSCNWANATQPASDHVAQASAGLAMAAMLFKNDTAFAATLIDAAKTAFNQSLVSNITADNSFDVRPAYLHADTYPCVPLHACMRTLFTHSQLYFLSVLLCHTRHVLDPGAQSAFQYTVCGSVRVIPQ